MKTRSKKKIIEINIGVLFIIAAIGILFFKNTAALITAGVLFCLGFILFLFEKMDGEEIANEELSEELKNTGFEDSVETGETEEAFEFEDDKSEDSFVLSDTDNDSKTDDSFAIQNLSADNDKIEFSSNDSNEAFEIEEVRPTENHEFNSEEFSKSVEDEELKMEESSKSAEDQEFELKDISKTVENEKFNLEETGLTQEPSDEIDEIMTDIIAQESKKEDTEINEESLSSLNSFDNDISERNVIGGIAGADITEDASGIAGADSMEDASGIAGADSMEDASGIAGASVLDEAGNGLNQSVADTLSEINNADDIESLLKSSASEDDEINKILAETQIEGLDLTAEQEPENVSSIDDVEKLLNDLKTTSDEIQEITAQSQPSKKNDEDIIDEYKNAVIQKQEEPIDDLNIEKELDGLDDLLKENLDEIKSESGITGLDKGLDFKSIDTLSSAESGIDAASKDNDASKAAADVIEPSKPVRKLSREPISTDILTELLNQDEDETDINEEIDELDELLKSDDEAMFGDADSDEAKARVKKKDELSPEAKKMEEDVLKILEM